MNWRLKRQRLNNHPLPSMNNTPELSLMGHLIELRSVLLHCLLAIIILFPLGYISAPYAIDKLVAWSFPTELGKLNYFSPMEVLVIKLKLGLLIAFMLAFPFIVWKVWQYLASALYEHEKRTIKLAIVLAGCLFLMGVIFCIFLVLPAIMKLSASFSTPNLQPMIGMSEFMGLCGMLMFSFGLMFQLPLMVLVAVKLGLTSAANIRHKRPYVIVAILIVAAILTPTPDIVNQLLLAIPTWLLFELGTYGAGLMERKSKVLRTVAE